MFGLILCLAVVPILPGMCALEILYGKKETGRLAFVNAYVLGWMLCMLVVAAVNGVGVFLGQALSTCTRLLTLLIAALEVLAVMIWGLLRWKRKKSLHFLRSDSPGKYSLQAKGLFLLFGLLVFRQIVHILRNGYVYMAGDMTLETVQSFLDTDALYGMNPLTGQPYSAGVPMRIRILCLPTFYAMLCQLFELPAMTVVWIVMPIYHLICGYLVYLLLAERLFPGKTLHKGCFLVIVALVLGMGTYAYGMDGLGLLYRGFRGESVRGVILLPYALCQALDKKWLSLGLCVLVELFVVWTLYGMGACLFVGAVLFLLQWLTGYLRKRSEKEVAVCGK